MDEEPMLKMVDSVTVPVPELDVGLRFYSGALGHPLRWRNDEIGQAGLELPGSDTELVLSTSLRYEPNWLVDSVDAAVKRFETAGGRIVHERRRGRRQSGGARAGRRLYPLGVGEAADGRAETGQWSSETGGGRPPWPPPL
jgi:catechol 2,3-dioxygenase-like lactoylglutathione lyase family enzyme